VIEDELLFFGRVYIVVATIVVKDYPEISNTLNYSFIATEGTPEVKQDEEEDEIVEPIDDEDEEVEPIVEDEEVEPTPT
jgi:hypothetical protein